MIKDTDKYSLGYQCAMAKDTKTEFKLRFFEKSYAKGLSITLLYITSIYVALIGAAYLSLSQLNAITSLGLWLACAVFITRQMRALENVVHFGSHSNFSRNRKINDLMTNALAAWPMLQDVFQYRKFHALHHGEYGSDHDPCRARFEAIGATYVDITSTWKLICAIVRWMPQYVREFYREVKSSNKQLTIFIVWHGAVATVVAASFGTKIAIFGASGWLACMFIILPFLRSIAEFSEHDYERADTVKETTFNNLGVLDHLLFHPAGDAWHALHHLYPVIPWWKQGAAHRFLMKHDSGYRSALHREQLFQEMTGLTLTEPANV